MLCMCLSWLFEAAFSEVAIYESSNGYLWLPWVLNETISLMSTALHECVAYKTVSVFKCGFKCVHLAYGAISICLVLFAR
jgi:hypothetical protein